LTLPKIAPFIGVSSFDPFGRRALAGRLIVDAAFETPAVVTGLDDVAVMGEAIEQRGTRAAGNVAISRL
jgi:hypothetical protein